MSFEIDTFKESPYLEIESNTKEKVRALVKKLGYEMKDAKPWSSRQVIEYYEKIS